MSMSLAKEDGWRLVEGRSRKEQERLHMEYVSLLTLIHLLLVHNSF